MRVIPTQSLSGLTDGVEIVRGREVDVLDPSGQALIDSGYATLSPNQESNAETAIETAEPAKSGKDQSSNEDDAAKPDPKASVKAR